ncbi:MAG: ABC transporter ATP-binding protein/permease [Verrucomicrobia bacterium]|nr:ABC transporter ATP-binding protein/permease [Verrucomicrobiota bacterium]
MSPLSLLWSLMTGFRLRYAFAITALLVSSAITYLVPLIGSATIDYALSGLSAESGLPAWIMHTMGGAEWVADNLWLPASLMVILTVLAGMFHFLKGRAAAQASDGIARRLKNDLYDHLQHLPAKYHDNTDTGDLIQRSTSDVETIRLALSNQIVEVFHAALLMVTVLPIMVALDVRMTLVAFALIGPIILYGFFYFRKVKFLFRQVDEAEGEVTHRVQENLTGLRVVRAFARQDFEIQRFADPNQRYRDHSIRLIRLMAVYWSVSDFVVLLQQGLVLFTGIWFIAQGSMTVGTLFAFMMFLNILLWPVRMMGRVLTDFGKSLVALQRVGTILQESRENPTQPLLIPQQPARGALSVRNLSFNHAGGIAALNGISFDVEPGKTLAIVGPSGAGKSTLMHLLLRLYDYDSGSIQLDAMELNELDRKWVRSQFSVVMQEPFLYSKTIGENIRFGAVGRQEVDLTSVARQAHIHDTILGFSQGYDTLVGERGVTLSGGQRQRVALARALLRNSPVLILDDALSAVDAETENIILKALKERRGQRTTLVIAHRLSTLAHADLILVMDHGKIVQSGTHDSLITEQGLYQKLWQMQISGEEI